MSGSFPSAKEGDEALRDAESKCGDRFDLITYVVVC